MDIVLNSNTPIPLTGRYLAIDRTVTFDVTFEIR